MRHSGIGGEIGVDEIPALWNKKYKEYLGVDVPNDEEGCLQDIHWSGACGCFPSYVLGNAYGAQILRTMETDIDVFGAIRRSRLCCIVFKNPNKYPLYPPVRCLYKHDYQSRR
ncbi:MAG: hypothetical protein IJ766_00810 [Clostridia bacterium]|nr:hypothetical protein [Clostridia bacterium]